MQVTKKATDLLKTMANPPEAIKYSMKAICLILMPNPGNEFKEKAPGALKAELNWWKVS